MMFPGDKFNRLTVSALAYRKGGRNYYIFICDCGNTKVLREDKVRTSSTRSCGCLAKEGISDRNKTHGYSLKNGKQARLHRIWSSMKARCSVKSHQSYANYGGREISVCDEWFNNYLSFHNWAMSSGYNDTLTIDRIDNDGNYEPENCRWIPKNENSRKTRCVKLTDSDVHLLRKLHQEGVSIKDIANKFNISKSHVSSIINNHRWKTTKGGN